MQSHPYSHELARLDDMLRSLGRLVHDALRDALLALRRMDTIGARQVIADDTNINALQNDVDRLVYRIVALRQPVARDLRQVLATASVANELERAGDYAKTIAKAVLRLETAPARMLVPPEVAALGDVALRMLTDAVAAFVAQDVDAARRLAQDDEQADRLTDEAAHAIRVAAAAEIDQLEAGLALLRVVTVLERLADRATNIGERAVFFATGEIEMLNT